LNTPPSEKMTCAVDVDWSDKSSGARSVENVPVPSAALAEEHMPGRIEAPTNFTASPVVAARLKPNPEKTKSIGSPIFQLVVLIAVTPFADNKPDKMV